MRKNEGERKMPNILPAVFWTLGSALLLLFIAALLVANGVVPESSLSAISLLICLVSCFLGALKVTAILKTRPLVVALSAATVIFLFYLLLGMLAFWQFSPGLWPNLPAALAGGLLAGLLRGGAPKRRRK